LDAHALAEWKESGRRLSEHPQSAGVPLDVALDVFAADLVVDCSDSCLEPAARERSRERARGLLRKGRTLLLAAKTPLLGADGRHDRDELLAAIEAGRVGVNAVFGGAGRAVARELATLRRDAAAASTTAAPGRARSDCSNAIRPRTSTGATRRSSSRSSPRSGSAGASSPTPSCGAASRPTRARSIPS